jgi:hypothetical protein
MTREALDLALEALDYLTKPMSKGWDAETQMHKRNAAIIAIKQARSAPVQEPAIKQGWDVDTLLDKPAAQRQWVGLTDEERDDISEDWATDVLLDIFEVIRAIEAKLKEKNT